MYGNSNTRLENILGVVRSIEIGPCDRGVAVQHLAIVSTFPKSRLPGANTVEVSEVAAGNGKDTILSYSLNGGCEFDCC